MMRVRVEFGGRTYELNVPIGSRLERRPGPRHVAVIPGPRPDDTSTLLSPAALIDAAREGLYGLSMCSTPVAHV